MKQNGQRCEVYSSIQYLPHFHNYYRIHQMITTKYGCLFFSRGDSLSKLEPKKARANKKMAALPDTQALVFRRDVHNSSTCIYSIRSLIIIPTSKCTPVVP